MLFKIVDLIIQNYRDGLLPCRHLPTDTQLEANQKISSETESAAKQIAVFIEARGSEINT